MSSTSTSGSAQQLVDGLVDAGNAVLRGDSRAVAGFARRDGDGVEAGLAVGDEVAVAHDEAGPTQPMRKSLRRGSVGRSSARVRAGAVTWRVTPRIDEQWKPGRSLVVKVAVREWADDPPLPMPAMLDQRRLVGVSHPVENPVFADRWHREIELHVADEVLVGIAVDEHFDDKKRLTSCQRRSRKSRIQREVVIGRDVRLGDGRLFRAGTKTRALAVT